MRFVIMSNGRARPQDADKFFILTFLSVESVTTNGLAIPQPNSSYHLVGISSFKCHDHNEMPASTVIFSAPWCPWIWFFFLTHLGKNA